MRKNADPDRGKIAAASRANLRTLEASLSDDASYARELIREVRRAVDAGGDEAAIAAAYAIVIGIELIQHRAKLSDFDPEGKVISTDFIADLTAIGLKTREGGRKGSLAAHGQRPTREQLFAAFVEAVDREGGVEAAKITAVQELVAGEQKVSVATLKNAGCTKTNLRAYLADKNLR